MPAMLNAIISSAEMTMMLKLKVIKVIMQTILLTINMMKITMRMENWSGLLQVLDAPAAPNQLPRNQELCGHARLQGAAQEVA